MSVLPSYVVFHSDYSGVPLVVLDKVCNSTLIKAVSLRTGEVVWVPESKLVPARSDHWDVLYEALNSLPDGEMYVFGLDCEDCVFLLRIDYKPLNEVLGLSFVGCN